MLQIWACVCKIQRETEKENEQTSKQHRVVFFGRERGNETQPQLSRKQVAQLIMLHIFRFEGDFFRLQVGAKAKGGWSTRAGAPLPLWGMAGSKGCSTAT